MVVPGTTVFHGDLYPPNVHQKLPMGTGIREKLRQKLAENLAALCGSMLCPPKCGATNWVQKQKYNW